VLPEAMRKPPWDIDVYDDGTTLYVTPEGELDVYTAPRLADAFARLNAAHRALILEVSELTFVDSTGLQVLTSMRRDEPERFMLSGSSPALERVLELTNLTSLFKRLDG
jgi:anti-sigma B factor antagonist